MIPRAALSAFHAWLDGASEIWRQRCRAERAERERDDATANLDETRRTLRALRDEHGRLLAYVGIEQIERDLRLVRPTDRPAT